MKLRKQAALLGFAFLFPWTAALAQPAQQTKPAKSFAALPDIDAESVSKISASLTLSQQGSAHVTQKVWDKARSDYQQALNLWPDNLDALYGLAKCSLAEGNHAKALMYYRQAIYSKKPAAGGFRDTHPEKLMEFAVLLNRVGQVEEALSVYNHAAYLLDYQDSQYHGGQPTLKVLLPEVVQVRAVGDQVQYMPERLQALAETGIAYEETGFGSNKEAVAHMQEAVKLYPDSAVTYYYLGEVQLMKNEAAAKAAYQKAIELGDDRTRAAAKERLDGCL